jgi:hypothetical protein
VELAPAISGIAMLAIPISAGADSLAAIRGERQSDSSCANPQERSHAAANEDTHNSKVANEPANMRFIFTAESRFPLRLDAQATSRTGSPA